ncbi:uncharacterized protein DMAD_05291 [Drosophila madeirensis]|uniref:THAP-type domain-containing protein n=1 Tax=Drosophila madeirensis TaxID=30013 RepID=A0AAU9FM05_DROMD
MGGTRCTFRDCKVSSNRNPSMHFFKFPVRDPPQLEKWQICANKEILKVSQGKLANRAVCARHFRIECFMNYKMDRLIAKQTPTLMRVNKDLAWDFESLDENGEPRLVKLASPTLAHLKPPEGFECPLGYDMSDAAGDVINLDQLVNKRSAATLPERAIKRRMVDCAKEKEQELHQISTTISSEMIDLPRNGLQSQTKPIFRKISSRTTIEKPSMGAGQSQEMPMGEEETIPEERQLQLDYNKLKFEVEKLSEENAYLKQLTASMPSASGVSPSNSSIRMTKPQLYNGIKKYLGPTLAALVRMEMFGGSEGRTWKRDERRFAVELLQLGESIYEHCCEEWRFRLPSLRTARSWLGSKESEDGDDSIDL